MVLINTVVLLLLLLDFFDSGKTSKNDAASNQLPHWREKNHNSYQRVTDQRGCPVPSLTASLGLGRHGPLLLQDSNFIDYVGHFDRERVPERVVHSKGGGAFGFFEVTNDITQFCKARLFEHVGKVTPIAIRFSTVEHEMGSADTVRNPRGFAIKFYTEDGNYDLVGNNIENFPIRDPILFPSLIRSRKRNPQTHLFDPNMMWDFISLRPETTFHTMVLYSDGGIPDGFRHMHGFGVQTFRMVNQYSEAVYVKFHMKTFQGIKNIRPEVAEQIAGRDSDYSLRDLFNAIEEKNFPCWALKIQVMTFDQAKLYRWNPFDITKVWLLKDFPLIPVGKLCLNRNPIDYFTEIEQAAYHPGNLVPGIEASPDRMLQGRIFSYSDTQRYRLGSNFQNLPVNRPLPSVQVHSYMRDGRGLTGFNGDGGPNYFPNSFSGDFVDVINANQSVYFEPAGDVVRADTGDEDNFSQASVFWNEFLAPDEKQRLVNNIAGDLKVTTVDIQERTCHNFDHVSPEFGRMLREALAKLLSPSIESYFK